jgi:hypothetical protein
MADRDGALRSARVVCVVTLVLGVAPLHAADGNKWMRDCSEWVEKKGYSVDYIEQRVGVRPNANMARDWVPNLDPKDATRDDVVFLRIEAADGRAQRVEVVDEVVRADDGSIRAFKTSSMNIGKMVEPKCHITENFGKVRRRTVSFEQVIGAWRSAKP